MVLSQGTKAPDFILNKAPDAKLSLSDLRGRPVILVFYPADWSPVCGDELALFNEVLPEFQRYDAQLVGISVDGVWCHKAYANSRNLAFPLLADFEPKGEVSRQYDSYRAKDGFSERSLFVIDAAGVIRWSYLSDVAKNPGADGVLVGYAGSLGLDREWAAAALAEGRFEPRVREDFSSGVRSGVNGTPTFFINGQRYDGPLDLLLETLRQALISPSAH